MIIFIEDTNIRALQPLFNNETNSFDLNNKPNVVFNISSYCQLGEKLDVTPPYTANIYQFDKDYDIAYANHILSNNLYFVNFFKMIYMNYLGYNVFVLVGTDENESRQKMTESLMKLIQQRYTFIPRYVRDLDDIPDYYDEDKVYVDGLFNLDADKERYLYLTTSMEQLQEEMKYEPD